MGVEVCADTAILFCYTASCQFVVMESLFDTMRFDSTAPPSPWKLESSLSRCDGTCQASTNHFLFLVKLTSSWTITLMARSKKMRVCRQHPAERV